MQSKDDAALDFLESLVIFDRICPFAIEHLPPAMSRRVFDVGLDIGRIRNGLKPNRDGKNSRNFRSSQAVEAKGGYLDSQAYHDARMAVVRHSGGGADAFEESPSQDLDAYVSDLPLSPSQLASANAADGNLNGGEEHQERDLTRRPSGDALDFDLKPPPPNSKVKHLDTLAERLFSGDHLQVILQDPSFFLRFTAFLNRYKPRAAPLLVNYLDAQKALKAVEYANALAESIYIPDEDRAKSADHKAAIIEPWFEFRLNRSFESLVSEILPAYVTNGLTKVVTEIMVREITGQGMPLMRDLIGGLAEVFCLADPSVKDCPIVYASEEFYHTTRYAQDDVLGRNCRFLQGQGTSRDAIARLRNAIKSGQECCETLLNYRRDGSAFMNLLLIAPLYDNKGTVRYYLGAQIDVSGLVEEGRGLDSFERLLKQSSPKKANEEADADGQPKPKHLKVLSEFGQMLSLDESNLLQQQYSSRPSSRMVDDAASDIQVNSRPGTANREGSVRRPRRVLGVDEEDAPVFDSAKASTGPINANLASGGRLPGVYQNYLLVRPHPNLRVIFVSPALRIPGLLQSPFLSRIGGPQHVRQGLADAFQEGAAVTAKITWLPRGSPPSEGSGQESNNPTTSNANGDNGSKPPGKNPSQPKAASAGGPPANAEASTRYISCTPLLGSDDQIGVWMVIMVENELVTGGLASRERASARFNAAFPAAGSGAIGGGGAGGDDVLTVPTTTSGDSDLAEQAINTTASAPAAANNSAATGPTRPVRDTENMHRRALSSGGGGRARGGGAKRFEFPTPPRSSSKAKGGGNDYADYLRKSVDAKRSSAEYNQQQQRQQRDRGIGGGAAPGAVGAEDGGVVNGEGRIEEILTPAEEKWPPTH